MHAVRRRVASVLAASSLLVAGLVLGSPVSPASAAVGTCLATGTFTANGSCTVLSGETVVFVVKAANGGRGGSGGPGGAGGTGWTGSAIVAGGAGGAGGSGGAGGAGAKVTGTYTNTSGSTVSLNLTVLSSGSAGADGPAGADGTSYSATSVVTTSGVARGTQMAINPAETLLYVPSNSTNSLNVVNVATGAYSTQAVGYTNVASTTSSATSILAARPASASVSKAGSDGQWQSASAIASVANVQYAPAGVRFWATQPAANSVEIRDDSSLSTTVATVTGLSSPLSVAFSPDGQRAFVTEDDSVAVYDSGVTPPTLLYRVGAIAGATNIVATNARAYVSQPSQDQITVISLGANPPATVTTSTVSIPGARGLALDGTGSKLYVGGSNALSVVTTATNTVDDSVPLATPAAMVVARADGSKVWAGEGLAGPTGSLYAVAFKSTGLTGATGSNGTSGGNGGSARIAVSGGATIVQAGGGRGGVFGLGGGGGAGGNYNGTPGSAGATGAAGNGGTNGSLLVPGSLPAGWSLLPTTNTEAAFISFAGPPGAPSGISATAGDSSAAVAWTVDDTGGSAITSVDFALDDTTAVDDSTTSVTSPHTLTGLVNGQTYTVYVRLVNAAGAGQWSAASLPFTPHALAPPTPPPAYPPSPPRDVRATAGDASAAVTWAVPESEGSFPVTHYSAVALPGDHQCLVPVTETTCTIEGLQNGTTYAFVVSALNGAGWSQPSSRSNDVTPSAAAPPALVITGSRFADVVRVSGSATGIQAGTALTPWVRLGAQEVARAGIADIRIGSSGAFQWQRRAARKVAVYLTTVDGTARSNTVSIPRS